MPFKKGNIGYWKGKKRPPFSKEWKEKIRLFRLGKHLSEESKRKVGLAALGRNVGLKRSDEFKRNVSIARKGINMSYETKKKLSVDRLGEKHWLFGKTPSKETRMKMSISAPKGKNCHFWKGGVTPLNRKIRDSLQSRLWREAGFKINNYSCQKCKKKGVYLHLHHIQNFSQFPELRFDIDNGITFCRECHYKFHNKYGFVNNTKEQVEEFIGRGLVSITSVEKKIL